MRNASCASMMRAIVATAQRVMLYFFRASAIFADFRTSVSVARNRAWSIPSGEGLTRSLPQPTLRHTFGELPAAAAFAQSASARHSTCKAEVDAASSMPIPAQASPSGRPATEQSSACCWDAESRNCARAEIPWARRAAESTIGTRRRSWCALPSCRLCCRGSESRPVHPHKRECPSRR